MDAGLANNEAFPIWLMLMEGDEMDAATAAKKTSADELSLITTDNDVPTIV